ncbi:putative zinc protease [Planoprotostelium fungivorum]|uniref:Putative zinc protease n=1 Tax=Planoprotostelium fungivorum TaxID=1890364 RepID=A0A2P6N2K4_9EUKA|nr:putative zinc protease [Planoprotostelium fungivorum]
MQDDQDDEDHGWLYSSTEHPLSQISRYASNSRADDWFSTPLKPRKSLFTGVLGNGLKYVILPHQYPPLNIEATLEVNVGSLAEDEEEQGIAHFLEHMVFMGTEKYPTPDDARKKLAEWGMSFGGDANASTDFDRTRYDLHVPLSQDPSLHSKEITNMLDVLKEFAFKATIPATVVESERRVVLSEFQIFQTPEYRCMYHSYQQMHGNDRICKRFPTGKEEHVKKITQEDLMRFYKRHYRPDNVTLYICGAFDAKTMIECIHHVYDKIERPTEEYRCTPIITLQPSSSLIHLFQHDSITKFSLQLNLRQKNLPITTLNDIRDDLILSALGMAFENRIYTIKESLSNPPFTEISWNYYQSISENCLQTELSVTAHPEQWKEAVGIFFTEFLRLALHGLTEEEMKEQLGVVLKDSHALAEQNDTQPSSELIAELSDNWCNGNINVNRRQEYKYQMMIAHTITLDQVNKRAKELFTFFSTCMDREVQEEPFISIFVAAPLATRPLQHTKVDKPLKPIPKKISAETSLNTPPEVTSRDVTKTHSRQPARLRQSRALLAPGSPQLQRTVAFKITKEEVMEIARKAIIDVPAQSVEVAPMELISPSTMEEKMQRYQPHWIAPIVKPCTFDYFGPPSTLGGEEKDLTFTSREGIQLKRLSNGIRLNMKKTQFDARWVTLKVVCRGGRSQEEKKNRGACHQGLHTLMTGGAAGKSSEELGKYMNFHGIYIDSSVSLEFVTMEMSFSVSHDGTQRALQLLHVMFTEPNFDVKAFLRSQKIYASRLEDLETDVEHISYNNMLQSLLLDEGGDSNLNFCQIAREDYEAMTLEVAREYILNQLTTDNMEVIVVGDYEDNMEESLLRYLGTIPPSESKVEKRSRIPLDFAKEEVIKTECVVDEEERGHTYIGFPSINRWSVVPHHMKSELPLSGQPSYYVRILSVLCRLIENRLYSEVREKRGLTYDISCAHILYEFYDGGIFYISSMTSVDGFEVLKKEIFGIVEQIKRSGFTQSEFDEVMSPLVQALRTSLSTNSFWISMMHHLQREENPKNLDCTENVVQFYEKITLKDVDYAIQYHLPTQPSVSSFACTALPDEMEEDI